MRIGATVRDEDIDIIIAILNSCEGEVRIDDFLTQILKKNVSSSDVLFIMLQFLAKDGYTHGSKGLLKINKLVDEKEVANVKRLLFEDISKNMKLFVTPLEVGKFYQCPRRVWLEKVVMSVQKKEERGRVWDGEVLHLAINLLVKNLGKKDMKTTVEESVKAALEKYAGKAELAEERLVEFLFKLCNFIEEEKIAKIFTEKLLESFELCLEGTPDLICIKESGEVFPIDVKLGVLSSRGLKKEHLLQIVGETLLAEKFFRKRVDLAYLIYFESNSLVKVLIKNEMKREFLKYKQTLLRFVKSGYVPPTSKLYNFRKRVCQGCHVKNACNNIENLKRIAY